LAAHANDWQLRSTNYCGSNKKCISSVENSLSKRKELYILITFYFDFSGEYQLLKLAQSL
jgi:hypothetical protein